MNRQSWTMLVSSLVVLSGSLVFAAACGSSNNNNNTAGDGGDTDGTVEGGGDDVSNGGGDTGSPNDGGTPADGTGGITTDGSCSALGSGCSASGDCCSQLCTGGVCSYPTTCKSTGAACTTASDCCTFQCTGGKCATLGTTGCTSLGNTCTTGADCCSGRCAGGTCQPGSFCEQPGDICVHNSDCCSGNCTPVGNGVGYCAGPPTGAANCGQPDGYLCGTGTADGGVNYVEGGLPACGGTCCSRDCAPWGPTGVLVCQPASGCHLVGDLCSADSDCCGSAAFMDAGLPTSGNPVTCDKSSGGAYGVCRLPMGCKPNGDVCRLKTMSCSASCDCCAGNCQTQDTCKQDNVGVPRCANAQCNNPGGACATSADCCNGSPCVPNPTGNPPFVCYQSACVPSCGKCSNNADCCPGETCNMAPGTTTGTCGPCGTPDAGQPPPPPPDAAPPPPPDAGCALYGQVCTTSSQCCNNVPCTNGRCVSPVF